MARIDGAKIERLRGKRTQHDLASALRLRGHGTTQTTLSRWESGQQPRASVLPDLAAELGAVVSDLYCDDDGDSRTMDDPRDMLAALALQLVPFLPREMRETVTA